MKRWLPYPLLTLSLLIKWLLLNQSIALGHVMLGGAVAVIVSGAMTALRPEKARIRSLSSIPRLAGRVFADVIRSNMAVAKIILFPGRKDRVAGFVSLPLDMRSRYGMTVLACIITATPGTLWVQYDPRTSRLLVHVLDLIDEEEWIHLIKHRYERLLMEIFE